MMAMSMDEVSFRPPGMPGTIAPEYSEDGVDLAAIRWMLSLTPSERLRQLQAFINEAEHTGQDEGLHNEARPPDQH